MSHLTVTACRCRSDFALALTWLTQGTQSGALSFVAWLAGFDQESCCTAVQHPVAWHAKLHIELHAEQFNIGYCNIGLILDDVPLNSSPLPKWGGRDTPYPHSLSGTSHRKGGRHVGEGRAPFPLPKLRSEAMNSSHTKATKQTMLSRHNGPNRVPVHVANGRKHMQSHWWPSQHEAQERGPCGYEMQSNKYTEAREGKASCP